MTSRRTEPPDDETEPTPEEWRRLYRAAAEFCRCGPWVWMADDELFGVCDPESGEVGYCSVMGQLGEVFALGVFLGAEGYSGYRRLAEGQVAPTDFEGHVIQRYLVASFEDRGSLDPRDRAVISELGLRFRGRKAWPQFRSHRPGYAPWYLVGWEACLLATALEQGMVVAERVSRGLDLVTRVHEGRILVRQFSARGEMWLDTWQPPPKPSALVPVPSPESSRLRRVAQVAGLPRGSWEVDLFYLPAVVAEKGRRPYHPRLWLCVDREAGVVLEVVAVEPWRSAAEIQEAFISILERKRRLPMEFRLARSEARELIAPLATALGIRLRNLQRLPLLDEARLSLVQSLAR